MSKKDENISRKGVGVIESALGQSTVDGFKGAVIGAGVGAGGAGIALAAYEPLKQAVNGDPLGTAGVVIIGSIIGTVALANIGGIAGLFHGAHKANAAQEQFTELRVENAALKAENKVLHKITDSSYLGTIAQAPALALHS